MKEGSKQSPQTSRAPAISRLHALELTYSIRLPAALISSECNPAQRQEHLRPLMSAQSRQTQSLTLGTGQLGPRPANSRGHSKARSPKSSREGPERPSLRRRNGPILLCNMTTPWKALQLEVLQYRLTL